ncbi:hybrid sensor histidine kinase/response regulator [Oscillatoria sp. FACHB-1407]|uniref:ATP-binding response regulator n=1 Tax=Oscillatoria sp. FACHB-1407 TaxID=2692847 RepID=UPI0016825412|nr:hybrid sensor histidine kinase/response regulator [Oscillatoria sp. FACHB-1407]MBD2462970.1 hybrid sensor histidine kinase/response regulator [Oscillatoria sp. FACHB-1407]
MQTLSFTNQSFPLNPSKRPDRILVVDDAPDNSYLIQAILKEEGYRIDIVDNGRDALAFVETSPPDLVLLDVMMPGMDGFEVTRRIRENQNLPFIPILLITAHDKPRAAQGLDTGAEDFIRKPIEFEELLARVRSLLKLKHSVDERDQIARQREDFVSRLTHDLRTPLVAADRMLSLIQQGVLGELSPELSEAMVIMSRSNQNLLEMVNALLEVYCYEAGKKTLAFTPINMQELLLEVLQSLTPLAIDKGLELRSNLNTVGEVEIMGDRLELRRVFMNLVGNAIKFTDTGFVEVRLGTTSAPTSNASNNGSQWVKIEVQDSGPGVAPEYRSFLFEPFRHGNHKRSGSGLGLHLSSQIVKAHHGKINIQSEVGNGSIFVVQLPMQQPR